MSDRVVRDRWIFSVSELNTLDKDVGRRGHEMQFDGRAKRTSAETQHVPFGASPCAPFDDDHQTFLEKLLGKRPLQTLNPRPLFSIMKIDAKAVQPIIRRQPNCAQSSSKRLRERRFAGTRQAANDD